MVSVNPAFSLRIASWNTQGAKWGDVGDLIREPSGADVLAIQEAGRPPPAYQLQPLRTPEGVDCLAGLVAYGASRQAGTMELVWVEWGKSNARCSLAMATNRSAGKDWVKVLVPGQSAELRPAVGIQVAEGVWVYGIHAPASGGAAAVAGDLLAQIAAQGHRAWACLGDFNTEGGARLAPKGATYVEPTGATHQGGRALDYAFAWGCDLTLEDRAATKFSDHLAQRYVLTVP